MAMQAGEIETLILAAIPDAKVTIRDLAGNGDHYAAEVVSPQFAGKSRVQQHQMVYQALKGSMDSDLHALALQTSAPE
ncbi:MAG: BolA family transcriptional regulator [Hyphomicrobiales bacterium]|nr:BolA family transcriptional regulator [Hyphomicrobiales bacterium]